MEPPSPIQALGVNPFPSRFIIRTVPGETSRADGGKSQSQRLNDTAIVLHETARQSSGQEKESRCLVCLCLRRPPGETRHFHVVVVP